VARARGEYEAARARFEESLAISRELGGKGNIAETLQHLGHVAGDQGDWGAARAQFEECLTMFRELGNRAGIAYVLLDLAHVAQAQGEPGKARALLEEAEALGRELDDKRLTADIRRNQGYLLLEGGDLAAARSRFEEGLALRREIDNPWQLDWVRREGGWLLVEVGHAAWLQGESAVAHSHAREALALFQELGNREGLLAALESLAVAALPQGPATRRVPARSVGYPRSGWMGGAYAARLLGCVEALREALGVPGTGGWRRPRERIGESVRAAALREEFGAAWTEGRTLSLQEAIRYALQEPVTT
jgi:tetratricopeptide (TPR) repeat protein